MRRGAKVWGLGRRVERCERMKGVEAGKVFDAGTEGTEGMSGWMERGNMVFQQTTVRWACS